MSNTDDCNTKRKEMIVDSYSLNEFHYHEALDRSYTALSNIENSLGDHPVIQSQPELQKLYDEVSDKLGELYQKIGQISIYQEVGGITGLKDIVVPKERAPEYTQIESVE